MRKRPEARGGSTCGSPAWLALLTAMVLQGSPFRAADPAMDPESRQEKSARSHAGHPLTSRPAPSLPAELAGPIDDAARYLALDPLLIRAVIEAESAYRPEAVSDRGAVGLMQLIPHSGGRDAYRYLYGSDGIPTAEGLRQPEINIWLGSAYLRLLMDHYLVEVPEPARTPLVLAAYNWGVGNLQEALNGQIPGSLDEAMLVIERRCPGVTAHYVAQVLAERDRLASVAWRG